MAVFRVDKVRDYTIMSNHHLRSRELSLKAKGLFSLMLSLPEDWDYTQKGLAAICKEGVDSISSTIRELEAAGYLKRRRIRDAHGRMSEIEYTILECPQTSANAQPEPNVPMQDPPELENPVLEEPVQDEPLPDDPVPEKTAQLNTKEIKTKRSNTKESITHSIKDAQALRMERVTDGSARRTAIMEQIEYDYLLTQFDPPQVDEIVELMLEVSLNRSSVMKLGRDAEYPTAYVQERFEKLTATHIEQVLDSLVENTTLVRNTKAYILTALFNSISTVDSHYTMQVNHDRSNC